MEIRGYRFNLQEFAGGWGDVGILLPLAVALITLNGLNPTSVFLTVGLIYLFSGLYYKVPISVQPLKVVAVVAIATSASPQVIMATAFLMGFTLLFLALSGLANLLTNLFSKGLVRGVQLAIGFLLIKSGLELILGKSFLLKGAPVNLSLQGSPLPLGIIGAIIGSLIILALIKNRRFPASLVIIALGMIFSISMGLGVNFKEFSWGPFFSNFTFPAQKDFLTALLLLVIPQIPLTLGNSIVAPPDVAKSYFGSRAQRVTPKALATSLGLGNLFAGVIGGLPICHGAGGVTAHYRFGARTGGATIMIGLFFLVTALVLGSSLLPFFYLLPASLLGVLLVYTGLEHSLLITDLAGHRESMIIALLIGSFTIFTGSLLIGFSAGFVLKLLLKIPYFQGLVTEPANPKKSKTEEAVHG